MSAPRWPLPWDVELCESGFAVVAADGSPVICSDVPLTSHRAAEVCALGDRALAAEVLAARLDAVRGYAQTAVDIGRMLGDASMERVGTDILRLLNGEKEAEV